MKFLDFLKWKLGLLAKKLLEMWGSWYLLSNCHGRQLVTHEGQPAHERVSAPGALTPRLSLLLLFRALASFPPFPTCRRGGETLGFLLLLLSLPSSFCTNRSSRGQSAHREVGPSQRSGSPSPVGSLAWSAVHAREPWALSLRCSPGCSPQIWSPL